MAPGQSESRIGKAVKKEVSPKEGQGEEGQITGDGADSAGQGVTPATSQAVAHGHHVDRAMGLLPPIP